MKKTMVFPYHPDMEILTEQVSGLKDASIVGFASYQEDESVIRELNEKLGNSSNLEEMIQQCDRVLFLEDYRGCRKEKYYEVLEKAIAAGKEIVLVPQLKKELDLEPYGERCVFLQKELMTGVKPSSLKEKEKYPVEIPVVAVMGLGKHCNKFENQILMKKMFEEKGYRVAWFSSNPLGVLFGGNTLPEFLFEESVPFEEKIFRLNHLMYGLSRDGAADVCIIGVPEGVSEFEKYEYHHFAEYALVIGNAVPVDSSVLCSYFLRQPIESEIDNIIRHIYEKFGIPIDMVSIGNAGYQLLEEELDVIYMFFKEKYIKEHYVKNEELSNFVVGIWEKEKLRIAMEKILERLCSNAATV